MFHSMKNGLQKMPNKRINSDNLLRWEPPPVMQSIGKKMKNSLLFIFTTFIAITNAALAADIQVHITGIEEEKGFIRVALFPESKVEQFPQPIDVKQLATEAKTEGVSVVFKDVSIGTYAISVLHDKNNNSEMDIFLGIPKEPYGNSGEYTSFKPSYDNSKFNVANENITIEIEVH